MAITRRRVALIGTDEGTGAVINQGETCYTGGTHGSLGSASTDVDALQDDASVGDAWFYLYVTCGASGGTCDITISTHRVTNQPYVKDNADIQVPMINGTKAVPLGKRPIDRYVAARIFNNTASGNFTFITLAMVIEKLS